MEAVISKKLVVLLERDFKNERLQKRNGILGKKVKNPPKNHLLTGSEIANDDVVEILPEDITDISSDDDFDPLPYKWEQDDWYRVELPTQEDVATNSAEFEINRINSTNGYVKKHIEDKSQDLNLKSKDRSKTRLDPFKDKSDDSDYVPENSNDSDSSTDDSSHKQIKTKKKSKLSDDSDYILEDDSKDSDDDSKSDSDINKGSNKKHIEAKKKSKVSDDSDYMLEDDSENYDGNNKSDSEVSEGSDCSSSDDQGNNKQIKAKTKSKDSVMKNNSREERLILQKFSFYSCTLCKIEVQTPEERNAHRKFHNMRYLSFALQYRCSECPKVCFHSSAFKLHWRKHAGKEIFSSLLKQCPHCPYKGSSKIVLKRHLRAHKQKGKLQCEFCSYSHDHQKNLTKHLYLHNKFPSGIYSCKECSYTTKCNGSFYRHKKVMHNKAENNVWYNCPHCPFKTIHTNNLKRHVKKHNQTNGIKCPRCTYTFSGLSRAREHLKLHYDKEEDMPKLSELKPFLSCSHCPYKTRVGGHLQRHLMVHDIGTKTYCADCPFNCKDKVDLIRHVVWHKKNGRYKCPWCSYSHDNVSALSNHKRVHREDRETELKNSNKKHKERYRCPICREIFQHLGYVKRHILLKHQKLDECKLTVYCANCPYKSKQKNNSFIKHVQGHLKKDGPKCDYCSFRHDWPRVIKSHMKLHDER